MEGEAEVSEPMPVNAGLANFGAGLVGLPMDTVKNALNLGIAGFGAAKTAITGKPGPDLIETVPGDSSNVKSMLRSTGLPGLSPDNPNPDSKMGTAQYDFVSRGGVIPGGALPAAGSMLAEKFIGPEWAGVGALAPTAAITGFNAVRAPGLAQEQAQNQVRDAALRPAQDAGYVVPPSTVRPTLAGNIVESFGGKAAFKQQAELKNQQVTNRLVREELRLPPNTPLTEGVLQGVRDRAGQPYREVSAMSPLAANTLQRLRDARAEANVQYRHYDRSAVPEALREARRQEAQAAMLERVLEREAVRLGRPELIPQLRAARTEIAKTWDVERSINVGDGNVDAKFIGRSLDRGRPLSGNLETIGRFTEGAGRQFTREAASVPAAGVSALNFPAAALLGFEGAQAFGPAGVVAAGIPFVRGGVRGGVLSDLYQQNFNRPDYTPNMRPQGSLEALIQQSIIENQR
jgi:hypothetical protein